MFDGTYGGHSLSFDVVLFLRSETDVLSHVKRVFGLGRTFEHKVFSICVGLDSL